MSDQLLNGAGDTVTPPTPASAVTRPGDVLAWHPAAGPVDMEPRMSHDRAHAEGGPDRPPLVGVTVVVPARNEEKALPHCLTALERALVEVSHLAPAMTLRACIVLDSCTDDSLAIVRAFAAAAVHRGLFSVEPLDVTVGSVGRARAAGVRHALEWAAQDGIDPAALWLASTDADTHVPPHWLSAHVATADAGADAYVGTVEPDAALTGARREEWMERHHLREGHPHVHGANLGVRASAYLRVGGFAPLALHEDVDLVERLRAEDGRLVRAADDARVVTSSRLDARAVGGFATYLANLRGGVA